ncbi:hypothetical protein MPC4_60128 [Methylocella tundrae]|uniref:Uncharacterized protein n=1 Tax=Methylocella tundrae TaxID=227605 RepID=A0A8B6MCM6_METTU|nr:hypothetical protein MPC1_4840003 [Methylocella tundrae]VTZ52039.1 hypothetical protein MPC4_60128 [Methylocella tundrae]
MQNGLSGSGFLHEFEKSFLAPAAPGRSSKGGGAAPPLHLRRLSLDARASLRERRPLRFCSTPADPVDKRDGAQSSERRQ